jgi:DNA (cytosine-5)-methyltransferase 1
MKWKPVGFSEIEKFPSQVLAHHYPEVTNYGDMTKFKEWNINEPVNLLVGGTPCQSFSVAGLRKGLDDPRGNLMLTFLAIADHYKPKWIVWENVPGVLSSNGGKDFGTFLGALGEIGYGFAYRVLDAQYFGVAQRRRRVFVVGCLGDWRSAAAVLFDSESLRGNPAPSREKRQEVTELAGTLAASGGGLNRPAGNANELDFCVVAKCLTTGVGKRYDPETESLIPAYGIQGNSIGRKPENGPQGSGISENVSFTLTKTDRHGVAHAFKIRGGCEGGGKGYLGQDDLEFTISTHQDQHIAQPITIATKQFSQNINYDVSSSLLANDYKEPQAVFQPIPFGVGEQPDVGHCLRSGASKADKHESTTYIKQSMAVRRLTPTECERLQGFPDGYTDIQPNGKPTADGPRYKALGNSMAVPVMKWIGERINFVDKIK